MEHRKKKRNSIENVLKIHFNNVFFHFEYRKYVCIRKILKIYIFFFFSKYTKNIRKKKTKSVMSVCIQKINKKIITGFGVFKIYIHKFKCDGRKYIKYDIYKML